MKKKKEKKRHFISLGREGKHENQNRESYK